MVKLDKIAHHIELPEGVSASLEGDNVIIAKEGNSVSREFRHPRLVVSEVDGGLEVFCDLPRRSERALAGTWNAHLKNMVKGVDSGFEYRLQAVYSHFPMTIKVQGNELTVTNLFGEKVPRVAKLPWTPSEVEVRVENKTDILEKFSDIDLLKTSLILHDMYDSYDLCHFLLKEYDKKANT
mgnify:CR=1 FL=1